METSALPARISTNAPNQEPLPSAKPVKEAIWDLLAMPAMQPVSHTVGKPLNQFKCHKKLINWCCLICEVLGLFAIYQRAIDTKACINRAASGCTGLHGSISTWYKAREKKTHHITSKQRRYFRKLRGISVLVAHRSAYVYRSGFLLLNALSTYT